MPTNEFKKLLDREFSKAAVRPITELASPLLQELVNQGLMIFRRCDAEAGRTGKEDHDVAALIMYRHIIEMVDAIEVLVSNSCGTAAIPVLRSAFEGMLGLMYLLEESARYAERALSWLVTGIHIGIRARQVLESGTSKGREYAQLYEKEFGGVIPRVPKAELAADIQQLENLLETGQFTPIEAEYSRTRKALNRNPDWFSLFGGPKNRSELAERLGMGAIFRLLYWDWSTLLHGNDLRRYLSSESGRPAYDGVRRPNELQTISRLAAVLLLRATRVMIEKFRKGENLEPWYARDVKPLLERLAGLEVTFTSLTEG